jgi:glycine cleavage system T protein
MAKVALATEHVRLGAQTIEQLGWELSADYGDKWQEYQAVRNGVGVIDISNRGRIEVTGKNRIQFLHNLVSNDVKSMQPGNGIFAAFLNVRGHILSDCFIYMIEDSILLDVPTSTREKIYYHLEKYSPAGEFNVTDITEASSLLALQGPLARPLLNNLGAITVNKLQQELQITEAKIADHSITVVKHSRTGEEGFDLFISNENIVSVFEVLVKAGAKPVGQKAFDLLRIEAAVPEYGVDMDEDIILLETGLESAVSYNKGCYLGQEPIARIHHRGRDQTAKRLAGLVIEGEDIPNAKSKVFNKSGKDIGYITSAGFSPILSKVVALAYLKRNNFTEGLNHSVEINGKQIPAQVSKLPFYYKG